MVKQVIRSRLVSTEHGFYDFDISDAGTIRRVKVPEDVQYGQPITLYYGDGHYVPHRKETTRWLGRRGVAGYLTGDLEKSIRKSPVFVGESADSGLFYRKLARKHCVCGCTAPYVKDVSARQVLGVDLGYPEYGRSSGRYIVYIGECGGCGQDLTFGDSFCSFYSTGHENLKALAQREFGSAIDWSNTVTSIA